MCVKTEDVRPPEAIGAHKELQKCMLKNNYYLFSTYLPTDSNKHLVSKFFHTFWNF